MAKAKAAKEKQEQEEKEKKEQQAKELKEKKAKQLEMQKMVSSLSHMSGKATDTDTATDTQAQSSAVSPQGLEEYKKYFEKIEAYKANIRPKLQNDVFRKQCFQAKLVIKRTVSQLQADHRVIAEKVGP